MAPSWAEKGVFWVLIPGGRNWIGPGLETVLRPSRKGSRRGETAFRSGFCRKVSWVRALQPVFFRVRILPRIFFWGTAHRGSFWGMVLLKVSALGNGPHDLLVRWKVSRVMAPRGFPSGSGTCRYALGHCCCPRTPAVLSHCPNESSSLHYFVSFRQLLRAATAAAVPDSCADLRTRKDLWPVLEEDFVEREPDSLL